MFAADASPAPAAQHVPEDVFAPQRAPTPPPQRPAMQPRLQPFALADRSRRRPKLTDPYPELEGHPYHPQPVTEMQAPAPLPAPRPPIITKRRERKIDVLIRQKIEDEIKEGRVPIITPCYNNLTDPKRPVPDYIKERLDGRLATQQMETRARRSVQDAPQTHILANHNDISGVPAAQQVEARARLSVLDAPQTYPLSNNNDTSNMSAAQQVETRARVSMQNAPHTRLLPDYKDMKGMPAAQTFQPNAKPIVNDARKRVRRPIPRPDTSYLARLSGSTRIATAPQHPRSALEDIISDAPNDAIGEETYASLKDMAEDRSEEKEDLVVEDNLEDQLHDLTQVGKDHRQEDLALEALTKRLNITQTTVQDANRGLRRLSNKIDDVQAAQAHVEEPYSAPSAELHIKLHTEPQPGTHPEPTLSTLPQTGSLSHTSATQPHVCCNCPKHDQSLWGQLWTEFSSNFYQYDAARNFYHNITWLGWTAILWIIWFTTEMALYPYYADDLFGPLFPFVTMNVCLRPFMPILVPAFRFLSWSIGTLFNIAFGETATSNGRVPPGRAASRVLDTAASIPGTTASITKNIVYSTWEAANEMHEHMGLGYDDYL